MLVLSNRNYSIRMKQNRLSYGVGFSKSAIIQVSQMMFCISEIRVDWFCPLQQINSVLCSAVVSGTGKTVVQEKMRILE